MDPESVYAKAYKNGFQNGMREFCNFKTGYIYGFLSAGKKQKTAVPSSLQELFSYGFRLGNYMSKIQQLKATLENKIDSLEREIKKQEKQLQFSSILEKSSTLSHNTLKTFKAQN